jgi:hypothetical protein
LKYGNGNTYSNYIVSRWNKRKEIGNIILLDVDSEMGFLETLVLDKRKRADIETIE